MLSVATSIDALAVGLSLAVLGVSIWWPALVIGVVAGALTVVGLELGCRFGSLLGRRMEIVGGLILIGIGVKILVEHLAG
jgi:putative Mn2+ efflux pump MntP